MTISNIRTEIAAVTKSVLIVDDHPVFRFGLAQLLGRSGGYSICAEAWNASSALQAVQERQPDIALVDISMPGTNGIDLIKSMLAQEPRLLVLVVSLHDETLYALRALRAGAKGYVMKDETLDCIMEALQRVVTGGIYVSPRLSERLVFRAVHGGDGELAAPMDRLSDRELEVLELLGRGANTRAIAAQLNLGIKTVETHRAHLKKKLGFNRQEELVKFASEWKTAQLN
jgi:DNA-binding NarL/FixJ family response regulator